MKRLRPVLVFGLPLVLAAMSPACGAGGDENLDEAGAAGGSGGANVGTGTGANETFTGLPGATGGSGGAGGEPGSRAGGNEDLNNAPSGDGKGTLPECITTNLVTVPYYLSADDSSSMASPVLAREHLMRGDAPELGQLRTHEFLNYYNVLYPLVDPDKPELGLFAEMAEIAPSPEGLPRFRLQLGVQAFQVPRASLVLTFVVDASGSLVGAGIERERAALLAITHQLRQGDIVNIVKWANDNNVLLQKYVATGTGADDAVIVDAVNQLSPGGGSDLHGGLVKGYELAGESFDPNKLNRVVLLSDGGANLGELDRTIIEAAAIQGNGEGIYMVGIGVGPAQGYSDALMDLVTDAGRGAYVYLDSPEEADAVFEGRFDEIMNVAAHDVRVRMDLPEYMQIDDFYGEEYSTDPANIEPQNLAPGDSMVLNQVVYLADPAKACGLDAVNVTVTWKTPLDHQERAVSLPALTLLELAGAPPSAQMKKANAIIAYAEALRTGDPAELLAALEIVETLEAATGDPDLAEIAALLKMHPAL
jgi:Ca-activated chloride channel homolog